MPMETVRDRKPERARVAAPAPAAPASALPPALGQGVLSPAHVLELQRRVGNAEVSAMLEAGTDRPPLGSAAAGAAAVADAGRGAAAPVPVQYPPPGPGARFVAGVGAAPATEAPQGVPAAPGTDVAAATAEGPAGATSPPGADGSEAAPGALQSATTPLVFDGAAATAEGDGGAAAPPGHGRPEAAPPVAGGPDATPASAAGATAVADGTGRAPGGAATGHYATTVAPPAATGGGPTPPPGAGGAAAPAAGPTGAAGATAGPADQDAGSQGPRVSAGGQPPVAGSAPAGKRVDPHEDPGFQAMKGRAQQAGAGAKAHAPAAAGAAAAQAAAAPPAGDVDSQAGAAQVEEMAQQQPGTFDRATFVAAVKRAVDAAAPKTLEEADDFKSSGKAGRVKDEVAGLVKGGKKESEKDIKQATEAPPDASKAQPKPVRPMPGEDPGRPPAAVGAAAAMPAPRPSAETDLSAGPATVDAQMAEAEVTEPQLAKANEPEFTAAVAARRAAKEHATTAPAEVRKQEQDVLATRQGDAEGTAANQLAGMHGAKVKAFAKALGAKTETKGADEGKRAKVAAELQAVYDKTKAEVTAILAGLDGKVDAAFTSGEQAARQQFETYVETQMAAYKERRYSGAAGALRWATDLVFSLPVEVNVFYEQGRAGYLKAMDGVIGQVADVVGAELGAARARIAAGRAEIHKYVSGLAPDLRDVGRDAERKLESQFDELAADVDSKQSELVDSLAQKYVAARDAVDTRIDELKQANKGLVDKAADAIGGVVKTILKLKDMLLGVLKKSANVIRDIVADPIGFLGKLVDGVKAGLSKFVGNIATHLKNAFMDWLFGALAGAGIKLPEKLDLAGILDLTMQVLGLTYQSIRARVVKLVGAPVVERMEQVVDVFKTLVTKGVGGLWEWIKDKLSNLEEMVLGQIKEFLIEKVIKGGITWIISLLNPAAAFVKACKAIYDIVMWIVERGAQLMEFVNSVLDSIGAIAKGNISIVADKVEGALAKALPVAISFLASLLGLGGISEKIKSIIDTVRKPIDKAVDWVITGAVKGFKKMFGGAIGWAKGKATAAKDWAKAKAAGIRERFTGAAPAEDEGVEDDPRAKAGRLLTQRLRGKTDRQHVDAEVAKVRSELAPIGLHSLEVGDKREDGSRPIMASASDPLMVAVERAPLDSDVVMDARITVSQGTALEGLHEERRPRSFAGGVAEVTEREQQTEAMQGSGDDRFDPGRGGAYLLEPEEGSMQLEVVAFNRKATVKGSNLSHAERQFLGFFNTRVRKGRVKSVAIEITESPCGICAPDLVEFATEKRALLDGQSLQEAGVELTIYWAKRHTGARPTTDAHVSGLKRAGWTVTEGTNKEEEKIEVMQEAVREKRRRKDKTPV